MHHPSFEHGRTNVVSVNLFCIRNRTLNGLQRNGQPCTTAPSRQYVQLQEMGQAATTHLRVIHVADGGHRRLVARPMRTMSELCVTGGPRLSNTAYTAQGPARRPGHN